MRIDAERRVRLEKAFWGKVTFFAKLRDDSKAQFLGLIGEEGQICLLREDAPRAKRLMNLAEGINSPTDEPTDLEMAAMRALASVFWVKASFEHSGRMNITLPESLMSAANIFGKPAEIFVYSFGGTFEVWSQASFSSHVIKKGMPELLDRLSASGE